MEYVGDVSRFEYSNLYDDILARKILTEALGVSIYKNTRWNGSPATEPEPTRFAGESL